MPEKRNRTRSLPVSGQWYANVEVVYMRMSDMSLERGACGVCVSFVDLILRGLHICAALSRGGWSSSSLASARWANCTGNGWIGVPAALAAAGVAGRSSFVYTALPG